MNVASPFAQFDELAAAEPLRVADYLAGQRSAIRMLCKSVAVWPRMTLADGLARLDDKIARQERCKVARHWAYDANLLIALRQTRDDMAAFERT